MSIRRYNSTQPNVDKFLLQDGKIVNSNGDEINPPSGVWARRYQSMPPNTTRWLLSTGEMVHDKLPLSESALTSISNRVTTLEGIPPTDLSQINNTLIDHENRIDTLESNTGTDLTQVNQRLGSLETNLTTLNDMMYNALTMESAIGDIIMSGTVSPPNELFIPLDGRVDNLVIDTPAHRALWGDTAVVALVARWGTSFPDGRGVHFRGKNSARFTDVEELVGNVYQVDAPQRMLSVIPASALTLLTDNKVGTWGTITVTKDTLDPLTNVAVDTLVARPRLRFSVDTNTALTNLAKRDKAETRVKSHIVYYFMRVKHPTKATLSTTRMRRSIMSTMSVDVMDEPNTNIINKRFVYDPDTFEIIKGDNPDGSVDYFGQAEFTDTAEISGLLDNKNGYAQIYNTETKTLDYVKNNRGLIQYSIVDGSGSMIDYLGDIKDGYTLNPKINQFSYYDSNIDDWVIDSDKELETKINISKSKIDDAINSAYSKIDIFNYEYSERETQARAILVNNIDEEIDMVEVFAKSLNILLLDAARMIVDHADNVKILIKALGNTRMQKYKLDQKDTDIELITQTTLNEIAEIIKSIENLN